jgi:hypothetical protein
MVNEFVKKEFVVSHQNVRAFFYKINLISPKVSDGTEEYLWKLISNPANYTNGVSKVQGVAFPQFCRHSS